MLKLTRPVEPDCLRDNAPTWTETYISKRRANPKARFNWPDGTCYQHTRKTLLDMTQQHCAFCDGPFAESPKTIEHFRPKSRFPELAFAWSNLFPCCYACQSSKQEKFNECLLKPDDEDYRFDRYFLVKYETGEIEVSPLLGPQERERAAITLEIYGLNTPERKNARVRELRYFQLEENPVIDDFNYRFFLF